MKRSVGVLGGAALLFSVGIVASVAVNDSTLSPPGTVAALSRDVTDEDALPPWFSELPAADRMVIEEARLLGVVDGRSYFVVPGSDQTTCLLYTGTIEGSAGTCAATSALMSSGLYFTEIGGGGKSAAITAILLPDGYGSATSDTDAKVIGTGQNLAVLEGTPPTLVTLKGPDVADHPVDLGQHEPPG